MFTHLIVMFMYIFLSPRVFQIVIITIHDKTKELNNHTHIQNRFDSYFKTCATVLGPNHWPTSLPSEAPIRAT